MHGLRPLLDFLDPPERGSVRGHGRDTCRTRNNQKQRSQSGTGGILSRIHDEQKASFFWGSLGARRLSLWDERSSPGGFRL